MWSPTPSKKSFIIFIKRMPKFPCKTSEILNIHVFLKKLTNPRLEHAIFFFVPISLQKCKKWSPTPSKIPIIIFFRTIPKLLYKTRKIINFMFFKKTLQNWRLTQENFYYFFLNLKMQKVKSNTYKKINYHIYPKNATISV